MLFDAKGMYTTIFALSSTMRFRVIRYQTAMLTDFKAITIDILALSDCYGEIENETIYQTVMLTDGNVKIIAILAMSAMLRFRMRLDTKLLC